MQVFRASVAHLREISRIITALDFPGHRFSDPRIIRSQISRERYLVCELNNRIAGAMELIERDNACQIVAIASNSKGAGRTMVDFAFEECRSKRIPKLWCWSLVRYNARGFYEKMGFEESILLRKQWYGEDCYFFGKVVL